MGSTLLPPHLEMLFEECARLRERASAAIKHSRLLRDEIRQVHEFFASSDWHRAAKRERDQKKPAE
jgi:hypothetical protein